MINLLGFKIGFKINKRDAKDKRGWPANDGGAIKSVPDDKTSDEGLELLPGFYPKRENLGCGDLEFKNIRWTKAFLKSLAWKRYEEVCIEYLKIKNCHVQVTRIDAGGWVEIQISDKSGAAIAVVECKAWDKPIGVKWLRKLYMVMASKNIKHGIFLTTSKYSKDAHEFAKGKNLLLIDGDELVTLINGLDPISKGWIDHVATKGSYTTPASVRHHIKMFKWMGKTGASTVNECWGCVNYQKCRNIMSGKQ